MTSVWACSMFRYIDILGDRGRTRPNQWASACSRAFYHSHLDRAFIWTRRKRSTRWPQDALVTSTTSRETSLPLLHHCDHVKCALLSTVITSSTAKTSSAPTTPRETRMRGGRALLQVRHRALRPASANSPPSLCQPYRLVASVGCEHMTKNSSRLCAPRHEGQSALAQPRLALGLRKSESDPGGGGTVVPKFRGGF
jgi:hypothetical protein